MTPDESVELAHVVRACIKVVGCDFPTSLVGINVTMIHEAHPPVFIYVHKYYEYKCIYMPCVINKSRIIVKGRQYI